MCLHVYRYYTAWHTDMLLLFNTEALGWKAELQMKAIIRTDVLLYDSQTVFISWRLWKLKSLERLHKMAGYIALPPTYWKRRQNCYYQGHWEKCLDNEIDSGSIATEKFMCRSKKKKAAYLLTCCLLSEKLWVVTLQLWAVCLCWCGAAN